MEIITTRNGTKKLCHDGYVYTKKRTTKSTIRWECSQRYAQKCKGAAVTDLNMTSVHSVTSHTHDADKFAVEAIKIRTEIMNAADANRGKPGQILADKLLHYPVQVRAATGQHESLKRSIRRVKRGQAPKEPTSINDIPHPLPNDYTTTNAGNDEPFLIHDNASDTSRLLIFSSETGLELLGNAHTWYMDGTHSTAPQQFGQLFCIRVPLSDSHVSVVYALLPGKQQSHYEECFTAILDVCLQKDIRPNPATIVADYEIAIHNAVRSVIGSSIHIQGCFYHLTQATWRHIQSEGLQSLYREDKDIRHFCGQLDGLAFLPASKVTEGMSLLRDSAPDVLSGLVDYFDSTYVSGSYRSVLCNGRIRLRKTSPRFDPQVWNVHETTLNDGDRTNNVCESWNNGFRHLVGHSNPSLWTVINCLQKDNSLVETEVYRDSVGENVTKRRRKETVSHQRKLKKLCEEIQSGTKSTQEFLHAIGKCVRLVK